MSWGETQDMGDCEECNYIKEEVMKKLLALLTLVLIIITLVACAKPQVVEESAESHEGMSWESVDEASKPTFESLPTGTSSEEASKAESSKVASSTSEWTPKPKNPATLSAKQERQIKKDWVSAYQHPSPHHTTDNVTIKEYLGTYNGGIVIIIEDNYHTFPAAEGFYNHSVTVWKNGDVKDYVFAHRQGWISEEDLKNIQYYLDEYLSCLN
jgi:hypothetical protein